MSNVSTAQKLVDGVTLTLFFIQKITSNLGQCTVASSVKGWQASWVITWYILDQWLRLPSETIKNTTCNYFCFVVFRVFFIYFLARLPSLRKPILKLNKIVEQFWCQWTLMSVALGQAVDTNRTAGRAFLGITISSWAEVNSRNHFMPVFFLFDCWLI